MSSVFHQGELDLQALARETEVARRNGKIVTSTIGPSARGFLAQQRLVAVATVAPGGERWASVLCAEPGFVSSADGRHVTVRAALPQRRLGDACPGAPIGLLAIELQTRRRLRVNGTVSSAGPSSLELEVRESFPNCPKYIQRREVRLAAGPAATGPYAEGATLHRDGIALLERVDTAFVASGHPERGADASHRGGEPGFLRVVDAQTIRMADYPGNGMFMTLGNLRESSRAGLTAVDFENGRALHLTGEAALQLELPEDPRQPTGGTGRYWDLRVTQWYEAPLPVRSLLLERSPFNP